MAEIKTGDKMWLTNDYEKMVEVTVTKITPKRVYFTGSHFYTFANTGISDRSNRTVLHRTKADSKNHLIKPLLFRINNYQEEIYRINSL